MEIGASPSLAASISWETHLWGRRAEAAEREITAEKEARELKTPTGEMDGDGDGISIHIYKILYDDIVLILMIL